LESYAVLGETKALARDTGTNGFDPIPLERFYERAFSSYKPTESWALVPQGMTHLGGVPFRMFGKLDLTGLGRARDGEFKPPRIGEIPLGQRAARIHLVHGASYDAPDGTPIACLLLHYENGEERRVFIRYGVHVRNWYIERWERKALLSDPESAVIWNGNTRADGSGTPTRLFKTTLENPRPGDSIRGIELLSLFARANAVIVAITLEATAPPNAPAAQSVEETEDIDLRREMLVRTLDVKTGESVSNIVVNVGVTEEGRKFGWGSYRSDHHGQILIDYPPGKFEEMRLRINDLVNPPFLLTVPNEGGIFPAQFPVRLPPVAARPSLPPVEK
jgi:hypothetical protein